MILSLYLVDYQKSKLFLTKYCHHTITQAGNDINAGPPKAGTWDFYSSHPIASFPNVNKLSFCGTKKYRTPNEKPAGRQVSNNEVKKLRRSKFEIHYSILILPSPQGLPEGTLRCTMLTGTQGPL
jgi:hypothetical protein